EQAKQKPPSDTASDDDKFLYSLAQLSVKGDRPTADNLLQFYPPELQEAMADRLVNKYAYQSAQQNNGKFQPSDVVLAMHLGHFPTADELKQYGDTIVHPADLGYPLAYDARQNPNKPVSWTELSGTPVGDPQAYFITQFASKYNQDVQAAQEAHNADCGPTCLAMMLVRYGRIAMPQNREKLIEEIEGNKNLMNTTVHSGDGYSLQQLATAANNENLHTSYVNGINQLDQALSQNPNASVLLVGRPRYAWQDNPSGTSSTYIDSGGGPHIVLS
ncbi:unnamed protein product, partial [marine sediment metagenome]